MPSSEQEMRERARKFLDRRCTELGENWQLESFRKAVILLADFATLERAEARREALTEAIEIAKAEREREFRKEKFGITSIRKLNRYGAGCCERIGKLIRAKLTPAPEAEKG